MTKIGSVYTSKACRAMLLGSGELGKEVAIELMRMGVEVVAYDKHGNRAMEKSIRTAGKPHHLVATINTPTLTADGEELAYITVQVADKDGNIVPTDNRLVKFKVSGAGSFCATANGDPTCLYSFQGMEMPLFSGALTAIVQAGKEPGKITFEAQAKGVKPCRITIDVK